MFLRTLVCSLIAALASAPLLADTEVLSVETRDETLIARLGEKFGHLRVDRAKGWVTLQADPDQRSWLQAQTSFENRLASAAQSASALPAGAAGSGTDVGAGDPTTALGRGLAQTKGCLACHSIDGSPGVGPTWKGLHGKRATLADGSEIEVDEAYLRRSIREPQAQVVKGFAPIMPPAQVSDDELAALVRYIESLGEGHGAR